MKLNKLRDKIYKNAIEKGFYEDVPSMESDDYNPAFFAQKIALIHSELSECLEADRKHKRADLDYLKVYGDLKIANDDYYESAFRACIKDTVEDELADVIIRTLDLCGFLNIDIEKHIELKIQYNSTRGYKHGKKY